MIDILDKKLNQTLHVSIYHITLFVIFSKDGLFYIMQHIVTEKRQ